MKTNHVCSQKKRAFAVIVVTALFYGTMLPSIEASQTLFDNNGMRDNNPPNIPSNPYPFDGATNVSINTLLNWTGGDPDGDPVTYTVYFGTTSSPPIVKENQTELSYNPGTLIYSTTYYWMIIAWDNHSTSATGPVWNFTTERKPDNPPFAPLGLNPSWWLPNQRYNLVFSSTDPENDNVLYDVDWGDGNNSGWIGPYASGIDVTVNHNWTMQGNYTITVKTKDFSGMESAVNYSFIIHVFEVRRYLEPAVIFGTIVNRLYVGTYIYFRVDGIGYLRFPGRLIFPDPGTEIVIIYKYIGLIIVNSPDIIFGFFNAVIISDTWP